MKELPIIDAEFEDIQVPQTVKKVVVKQVVEKQTKAQKKIKPKPVKTAKADYPNSDLVYIKDIGKAVDSFAEQLTMQAVNGLLQNWGIKL